MDTYRKKTEIDEFSAPKTAFCNILQNYKAALFALSA